MSAVLTPSATLPIEYSHGTSGTDTHSNQYQSPGAPDLHAEDAAIAAHTQQLDGDISANISNTQQQQQQLGETVPSSADADDLQLPGADTVPINALASPATMNKLQQLWTGASQVLTTYYRPQPVRRGHDRASRCVYPCCRFFDG